MLARRLPCGPPFNKQRTRRLLSRAPHTIYGSNTSTVLEKIMGKYHVADVLGVAAFVPGIACFFFR